MLSSREERLKAFRNQDWLEYERVIKDWHRSKQLITMNKMNTARSFLGMDEQNFVLSRKQAMKDADTLKKIEEANQKIYQPILDSSTYPEHTSE